MKNSVAPGRVLTISHRPTSKSAIRFSSVQFSASPHIPPRKAPRSRWRSKVFSSLAKDGTALNQGAPAILGCWRQQGDRHGDLATS